MLSPPCTDFSALMSPWNYKNMCPLEVQRRWAVSVELVNYAMRCAKSQWQRKPVFVFEHPCNATSWSLDAVAEVQKLKGVMVVVFDQCLLGACTKVHKTPTRKRTKLMTNSPAVAKAFSNMCCKGLHEHKIIEGTEGGLKRSKWAEIYPPPLVKLLVSCIER